MNAAPQLSVIVPAYNGERHIAEAIASVRQQGHPTMEIIVVDDGSTDGTAQVVRSLAGPDLIYVHQANAGPAAARNHGVKLARAPIIAFIDADDIWTPDRIATQWPYMSPDSGIDVVLGLLQYFRESADAPGGREIVDPFFLFVVGCGLYRREVFDRTGMLPEDMQFAEDVDWFNRMRESGIAIKVLDSVAVLYRRHEGNMTRRQDPARRGFIDAVHRSLVRRRTASGGSIEHLKGLNLPPGSSREERR